jgi:hypothetical protein
LILVQQNAASDWQPDGLWKRENLNPEVEKPLS